MPVDTSIYAQQQHPDPLAGVGSALSLANSFTQRQQMQTQLQSQQMDLAAKRGAGNAFQQATDANGRFDPDVYAKITANNGAAILGPANVENAANASTAVSRAANASTELGQTQTSYLASQIYPMFNDPKSPPPKAADVNAAISNAIAAGQITPGAGKALTLEMLRNSQTPQKLRQWAQNKFAGSMGTGQAEPTTTVTTPAGSTALTKGQAAAAAQDGGTETPAGGIRTSPGAGVIETYKAANDQRNSDYGASTAILGNARNLAIALDRLNSLNPSDAGAVGDIKNKVLTTAVALGLAPSTTTMTREEAEKYLEKSKATMPAAQRSDMAQHLADISNPSLHTSLEATKALTRSAIGFARMDAAVPFSWDAAHPNAVKGQTDPDYLKYRPQFMNSQDPDAYVFDTLSLPEQLAMTKDKDRQGKAAVAKFRSSLQNYDASIGGPSGQIGQ